MSGRKCIQVADKSQKLLIQNGNHVSKAWHSEWQPRLRSLAFRMATTSQKPGIQDDTDKGIDKGVKNCEHRTAFSWKHEIPSV
jgi:hypothetical protein